MKIGDEVYIHGYVDEIRSDVVIIRNDGGYFGTVPSEVRYDCDDCRHWWKSEDVCLLDNCHYEPKTEPHHSGEVTEMGEPQTVRSNLEPFRVDEPQKCYLRESCDHYGDKQVCGRCRHYNLYSHTKTEPQTEPQIFTWGKEVHEFCKRNCDESKARMRDGDRFIVCGQADDEICISLRKCPLGKWVAGRGFHILPMDEQLTCDGNCWMKKQNGEWLCEHCQRKPKTEPQTCANGCKWLDQDGECTEPNGECHIEYRTQVDEPQTEVQIRKEIPVICAECDHVSRHNKYLYCELVHRTVYNAKPEWCPLPNLFVADDEPQTDYTPDCPFCKRYGTEECLGSDCRH